MSATTRLFACPLLFLVTCCLADDDNSSASGSKFVTKPIRGRVVWLAEALSRLHGIRSVAEAADRTLALETPDGELHILAEDTRGRAFRRDARLRRINVELLVRQYRGSPAVQVVRAFELTKDGKLELDYWCEICSIAMFELKECDCCQGPIELRRRAASDARN